MKTYKKAFTLVEMLVVIVLLTLLIATAVFAYKNMIINIKHTKKDNYKDLFSFHQLRSSIGSMKYYVLLGNDTLKSETEQLAYYFFGNETSARYITKNPIFSEKTSVAFLSCEENSLKYTETLVYSEQDYLNPVVLENSPNVFLYNDLSSCNISYVYKDSNIQSLKDDLPNLIHISITKNSYKKEFYFKVKSDANRTKDLIAGELFNEK